MSINRVNISGNLTRDPELRNTASGTAILRFGVAVNDRRKDANGNWTDYPNFVDCVMFGNRAQALSGYLHKGTKVAVEGKLRYSKWQDNNGQNRSKLEVAVDEVEFMSPRGDQGAAYDPAQPMQGYQSQQTQYTPLQPAQQPQQTSYTMDELAGYSQQTVASEDIPF